jgi:hypothetical protein
VGARSDGVLLAVGAAVLAQPARPETAAAAPLDALRKSLRLIRAMTSPLELPRSLDCDGKVQRFSPGW